MITITITITDNGKFTHTTAIATKQDPSTEREVKQGMVIKGLLDMIKLAQEPNDSVELN